MSDYIAQDILIEILLKLPAKLLVRVTSVCKAWQSLIGSPSFISLHLKKSENRIVVRTYNIHDVGQHYTLFPKREPFSINSSKVIDFPFKCPIGLYKIMGSCDGLVCLSNDLFMAPPPPVIIWNPTIRKHVVLPQSLVNWNDVHSDMLGFGVANNVYKVVRLFFYRNHRPRAEIFTQGTGTWRMLSGGFDDRVRPTSGCSWFFKGFVHWMVYNVMAGNDIYKSILTFLVGDEVFGEIVLPHEWMMERNIMESLAIIRGSFGAINCFWDMYYYNRYCDVWMMKDYGVKESWTKLYRIDCEGFQKVIGFLESSEVVLSVDDELVTYNAKTKLIKHVGVIGDKCSWYVNDLKESLVLLGGYNGDTGKESNL